VLPGGNIKQSAIIADVDGTVAKHDGIRGHYEYDKVSLDIPNKPIIDLIMSYVDFAREMGGHTNLIVMSGRPAEERVARDTSEWLLNNGIYYDTLVMRPVYLVDLLGSVSDIRDYRADDVVKEELYYTHVEPFYNVDLVFDDRDRVVKMWRRLGLTCLQVADGAF
jgi:hypothetical protein